MSMISNPRKNVTVDFTVPEIKRALVRIPAYFSNKYTLDKRNDILNQFTFRALEFLSLGSYIDINLNFVTETKSEIIVEVRRKIGAFDQWVEVQKANQHIENLFNGISVLLTKVRQSKAQDLIAVDVENPSAIVKYDINWEAIKQHINTLVSIYPNTYSIVPNNNSNGIVLCRKPQGVDDHYLDADALIIVSPGFANSDSEEVKFVITNDNDKIATQGELSRNNLILNITIKLIQKIINDLKSKIAQAETELANISKWKMGRSEETKQEQIRNQTKIIEDLNIQLKG